MRPLDESGPHPVLRGIRSGAVAGLTLVAVLSLPVLLVLTVKAPHPADDAALAPARVWAASHEAEIAGARPASAMPLRAPPVPGDRVQTERAEATPAAPTLPPVKAAMPTASVAVAPTPSRRGSASVMAAVSEAAPGRAEPLRGGARSTRPLLTLDQIPVLDDANGALTTEDAPVSPARPARSGRPAPSARTAKAP
ncbi:hypothetical protein ASF60_20880 [Methylobacterium sp. Leaf113]|nr:hypothetical protein ASF60_20880 [Methylobacterium sp. Leaf113]